MEHINPDTLAAPRGYSHVVQATGGRTIYISGQVALDRTGAIVGAGDLRAQTRQVFENLKAALAAVGATFGDVAKITIFMLDVSQSQIVREIRADFLVAGREPASTLVEIRRLAREEFLIEIEAVATLAQ